MSSYDLTYDGATLGKDDPVLEVDGLEKSFGGLVATDDVSLEVERGSITGIIGPNGAGKSTLFNLISGFYEPDEGRVAVNGTDVTGQQPNTVVAEGLLRTFQTPRRLESMTVREAMLTGAQSQLGESIPRLFVSGSSVTEQERENLERAKELLEFFEIDHLTTEPTTSLSGGQMKLLALARALMAEPDVLLLDEPVAGINPTLVNEIAEFIEELNREYGYTFFIIEHDIDFLMNLAEDVIVLNRGRVLLEGDPKTVQSDERVIEAYLGGT